VLCVIAAGNTACRLLQHNEPETDIRHVCWRLEQCTRTSTFKPAHHSLEEFPQTRCICRGEAATAAACYVAKAAAAAVLLLGLLLLVCISAGLFQQVLTKG
jgi:hypothetical protein